MYEGPTVERMTGTLGAQIHNLDLASVSDDEIYEWISAQLVEHKVLFFATRTFQATNISRLVSVSAMYWTFTLGRQVKRHIQRSWSFAVLRLDGTPMKVGETKLHSVRFCIVELRPVTAAIRYSPIWNLRTKVYRSN